MTKRVLMMKKIVAAGGFAVGLASLGGYTGIAAADPVPDTGTYDDQMDLAQEACWGGGISVPVAWEVGDPESAGCDQSRAPE